MCRKNNKKTSQSGMIAVETLIAFIAFLTCIFFMAVWVNVASMQARMHQSLTQTANEISFYTHAFEIFGITGFLSGLEEEAGERRAEAGSLVNNVIGVWDSISPNNAAGSSEQRFGQWVGAAETAYGNAEAAMEIVHGWGGEIGEDPSAFIQGFLFVGAQVAVEGALNAFISYVAAPSFFWRYLGGRPDDRTYRVATASASDIQFNARFLNSGESEIHLYVIYNLGLGEFLNNNLLPDLQNMTVRQDVMTRAWVGDSGYFQKIAAPAQRRTADC